MADNTTRIGRYATRRVLGSGAFATVWLGRDDELDVPIAIKVLADNWAHNADVQARFVEEARILRRISDPRVVGVHDIGTLPDGRSYFVMDFADGGTLADLVGGVDHKTAIDLAVEVGLAIQVLHDQQILHRDVKPSNMLLRRRKDRADQLMVADLGTAKALAEASGLTMSAGTPAYMAPEQAHGALPLGPSADVYGVAAVAYALLSGRTPFPDERSINDVANRDPARRPVGVGDGGPLDALLQRSLSFDPQLRPTSALDLVERLREVTSGAQQTVVLPAVRSSLAPVPNLTTHTGTTVRADPATVSGPATPTEVTSGNSPSSSATHAGPAETSQSASQPVRSAGVSRAGLIGIALALFVVSALVVWIGLGALGG